MYKIEIAALIMDLNFFLIVDYSGNKFFAVIAYYDLLT